MSWGGLLSNYIYSLSYLLFLCLYQRLIEMKNQENQLNMVQSDFLDFILHLIVITL